MLRNTKFSLALNFLLIVDESGIFDRDIKHNLRRRTLVPAVGRKNFDQAMYAMFMCCLSCPAGPANQTILPFLRTLDLVVRCGEHFLDQLCFPVSQSMLGLTPPPPILLKVQLRCSGPTGAMSQSSRLSWDETKSKISLLFPKFSQCWMRLAFSTKT